MFRLLQRGRLLLIVGAAILTGLLYLAAQIYAQGENAALQDTNLQNQEAGDAADHHSSLFQRCIDGGGVYDFATGQCRRR